jgi:hypothetical protein
MEHKGTYPEVERQQFEARLELRGKQYVNFLIVNSLNMLLEVKFMDSTISSEHQG